MSECKKRKKEDNESIEVVDTCTGSLTDSKILLNIENELVAKIESLEIGEPVEYVYNPLQYAKTLHETFTEKYFNNSTKKILFLGINPGPWGMCQNGIPFGEKNFVKDWFNITGAVSKPDKEHPKKKVMGLECHRSERSGKKFWTLFKKLCKTPESFFKYSFVHNLCPFAFVDKSGKNITPCEIKDQTKKQLNDICDEAFIKIIKQFKYEIVLAIGRYPEKRAKEALTANKINNVQVHYIPHPSDRNSKTSSTWDEKTIEILTNLDLLKYFSDHE